jgi:hypothetical protein
MSFWEKEIPKGKAYLILAACAVVPIMLLGGHNGRPVQQVSQRQETATPQETTHQVIKCEDRERLENQMLKAATGMDPVLIKRALAEAPMVIASGNGTPDQIAQLSKLTVQWSITLAKWRDEHPCL